MAKRLCRLSSGGRIVFDYDMKIAEPFRLPGGEGGVDLWPALESLRHMPLLLIRGQLSDLLSADAARQMRERLPELRYRSEEHTSELQSLMRISYAVFCLKKIRNRMNYEL